MRATYRRLPVLAALILLILGVKSPPADGADPRDQLQKRVYRDADGESIPYRLLVPTDYDPQKKYPLILFLHGAGERGDNNEAQLVHAQVLRLATDVARPALLVAPQCPRGSKWVEVPWNFKTPHETPKQPSTPMRLTLQLLDALDKEFSIDPDRRYVTGLSMGGFGTFDAMVRRPDYFAATLPAGSSTAVPIGRSRPSDPARPSRPSKRPAENPSTPNTRAWATSSGVRPTRSRNCSTGSSASGAGRRRIDGTRSPCQCMALHNCLVH